MSETLPIPFIVLSQAWYFFYIAPWTSEHGDMLLIHDLRQINLISWRTEQSIIFLKNNPSICIHAISISYLYIF